MSWLHSPKANPGRPLMFQMGLHNAAPKPLLNYPKFHPGYSNATPPMPNLQYTEQQCRVGEKHTTPCPITIEWKKILLFFKETTSQSLHCNHGGRVGHLQKQTGMGKGSAGHWKHASSALNKPVHPSLLLRRQK